MVPLLIILRLGTVNTSLENLIYTFPTALIFLIMGVGYFSTGFYKFRAFFVAPSRKKAVS